MLGFTLGAVCSMDLDKFMTYSHYYSAIQIKNLCVLPVYLLPQSLATSYFLKNCFVFSKMELYSLDSFQISFFHLVLIYISSLFFHGLVAYFF
jgi:hypothetical protein